VLAEVFGARAAELPALPGRRGGISARVDLRLAHAPATQVWPRDEG
jgi:hypothetical protein